jgi:hypothetical protein
MTAIYSTLGLAGKLAAFLRYRDLLISTYMAGIFLLIIAVIGLGIIRRPKIQEIFMVIGIMAVYGLILVRMSFSPEERTHLFEYSLVATIIHEALKERKRNNQKVPAPALLAILLTAVLGWIDEGIQALIPNRVYDIVDVGFNAFAGFLAVLANLSLSWVRNKFSKKK